MIRVLSRFNYGQLNTTLPKEYRILATHDKNQFNMMTKFLYVYDII